MIIRDAVIRVLNQTGKEVATSVKIADQYADPFYPLMIAVKRNDLWALVAAMGSAVSSQ